ncbi:MAG: hypothetical protein QM756_15540 [Polyangiaceae bacterium]
MRRRGGDAEWENNAMNGKSRALAAILLGAAPTLALGIAPSANANWERVNVITCDIPQRHEGSPPFVIADKNKELVTGYKAFCPVPDTTSIPVGSIKTYQLWGKTGLFGSPSGLGRVRACNAFSDTIGEECAAFTALPATFAGFSVPIPAFWSQWWHSQYIELDPTDRSNLMIGRILVKN